MKELDKNLLINLIELDKVFESFEKYLKWI